MLVVVRRCHVSGQAASSRQCRHKRTPTHSICSCVSVSLTHVLYTALLAYPWTRQAEVSSRGCWAAQLLSLHQQLSTNILAWQDVYLYCQGHYRVWVTGFWLGTLMSACVRDQDGS